MSGPRNMASRKYARLNPTSDTTVCHLSPVLSILLFNIILLLSSYLLFCCFVSLIIIIVPIIFVIVSLFLFQCSNIII